jgi:predicted TIM-barrel fold metal-dependent hydrolase
VTTFALTGHKPTGAADVAATPLPIVDTHQHLWDLTKLRLPWLKPGGPLTRSFVMKDYLEAVAGLNVIKAVYMEVAVTAEQKLEEAEYVLEICRRTDNPTVAAVIGGEPGTETFRSYISRFEGNPYIKGVRHIPTSAEGKAFLYEQDGFVADVRKLGEFDMSFDLCMPPQKLPEAIRLVDRCPDTRFIMDHCGNADPKAFWTESRRSDHPAAGAPGHDADSWRRGMGKLAERTNVVCKISGIVARVPKDSWGPDDLAPIVDHCLEVFGPDRVMFASDWPVCTRGATLRQWVTALKQIIASRPVRQQQKLLADNAARFYGLS